MHKIYVLMQKTLDYEATTPQTDYRLSNYDSNKYIFKSKDEISYIPKVVIAKIRYFLSKTLTKPPKNQHLTFVYKPSTKQLCFVFSPQEKTMFYTFYNASPVGKLLLVSDGQNLTRLQMEKQRYNTVYPNRLKNDDLPVFKKTKLWLDDYWQNKKPNISALPLKTQGSDFQQKVWQILQTIKYGECLTYGDIAKQIAPKQGLAKMSAQAVGAAVGHNPICIIIPCHRVVGANGNLTGYNGGIDKKIILLQHEGFDLSKFTLPKEKNLTSF